MKRLTAILLSLLLCAAFPAAAAPRALVVFFSHAGENYDVGTVDEGNTAVLAGIIAEKTGADIFEIVPVIPYSDVYDELLEQTLAEQKAEARPEYTDDVENWEQYDTVFIGFPIWWGEIPNIVYTFMDAHDFTGKTVVPFNTHEGSGAAHSRRDIEEYLPEAEVLNGLAVRGSRAQNDREAAAGDVSDWLGRLGPGY